MGWAVNILKAVYDYLFPVVYNDIEEVQVVPPGHWCAAYYTQSIEEKNDFLEDEIAVELIKFGDRDAETKLRETAPGAIMMISDARTMQEAREKARVWLPFINN